MSVIVTQKNDISYINKWLPKKCDTNKNGTKMEVIIKGFYCSIKSVAKHNLCEVF